MNPAYIDLTIQRISSKYGCLESNQRNLQYLNRNHEQFLSSSPKELFGKQYTPLDCLQPSPKKSDGFYEWPQISTISISPKPNNNNNSQPIQKQIQKK